MKKQKKNILSMLVIYAIAICAVLSGTAKNANAETINQVTINAVFDSNAASVSMYDNITKDEIVNGQSVSLNSTGRSNQIVVEFAIKEGYRIAKVDRNGVDFTATFIEGAYGGMAMSINEDTTYTLITEKIPAVLPSVVGAELYLDSSFKNQAGKTITFDDNSDRLYAKYAFNEDIPNFHAEGNWQVSKDGKTWYETGDYGWNSRNDLWPAWDYWSRETPFDLMNDKNYYVRIRVSGRKFYTQGEAYSRAIFVNADGTMQPVDIEIPAPTKPGQDVDDQKKDEQKPEVHEHKWDAGVITKEASETEEGIKTYTCTVCKETKVEKIAKLEKKVETLKKQTITVAKKLNKTVTYKASKLKKSAVTIKIQAKAKTKLTYKVTKGAKKNITVSSKGVITLKKNCKKGTYKVQVTAAKSKKYAKATKTITIKVK